MNSAKIFARIAATLLCLAASISLAATHPLNQPMGLAVDAKGNLYVANHGGNQILVYNPSALQMAAKTITTNINAPLQLTFDAQGNLWVSNLVPGKTSQEYFSEYGPNGKQINTAYTSNSGNNFAVPAFAVDGVGDLWISDTDGLGEPFLVAQNGPGIYNGGGVIDVFYEQPGTYTAIAAHGPWLALGTATSVQWELVGSLLGANGDLRLLGSSGNPGNGVLAMTFDNNSNLYYATDQGFGVSGVWFVNIPTAAAPVLPINVGYQLSGIAVDSVHGRLYISNASTNTIAIYSTSTWLQIGTIQ